MNSPLRPADTFIASYPARHRAETLLVAADVSKAFRGVAAVQGVTFELRSGEVHGLVGANGAGKSTFTRILAGAEQADSGSISLDGRAIAPATPRDGRRAGIAAIYQELSLVPEMSALSNVFLGQVLRRGPFVDIPAMRRKYDEMCAWMGVRTPASAPARTLSIADQQMVEIMRAMQGQNKVLIMDEPTAPIGPKERATLYALMKQLTALGTGLIFISHDLDEVLAHCDRISIMRDGRLIDTRPACEWSKASLVAAMLGDAKTAGGTIRSRYGPEIFSVRDVCVPGRVFNASFSVRAGEILGIAGLVGSGRTELLRAIAGADPRARGCFSIENGADISLPTTLPNAIAAGVVLVPEDRKRQGLILSRSSLANVTLPSLRGFARFSVVRRQAQRREAARLAGSVGFNPSRLKAVSGTLSGGNQQKLVIGKWLRRKPRVLLLDEPTRGVDLGAKHEIYQAVRRISDEGTAVVLVSSDLDEVVDNADRIVVLGRGRVLGTLTREDASVEGILNMVFGLTGVAPRD
jgi:rhamnose transport system ATP-binding protein